MPNFFTVKEIAETLKCDKHKIYNYINNGELQAVKIGTLLIREDWFFDFIESRKTMA